MSDNDKFQKILKELQDMGIELIPLSSIAKNRRGAVVMGSTDIDWDKELKILLKEGA